MVFFLSLILVDSSDYFIVLYNVYICNCFNFTEIVCLLLHRCGPAFVHCRCWQMCLLDLLFSLMLHNQLVVGAVDVDI